MRCPTGVRMDGRKGTRLGQYCNNNNNETKQKSRAHNTKSYSVNFQLKRKNLAETTDNWQQQTNITYIYAMVISYAYAIEFSRKFNWHFSDCPNIGVWRE